MQTKTLKTTAYWLTTGLLAVDFGIGGIFHLMRSPQVVSGFAHLGYPAYFVSILGAWKVLSGVALVAPGFPRLKEWAYAGIFFDLTGAALSLLAVGDGVGKALFPLVFVGITYVSWLLRSGARALPAPAQREGSRPALAATSH